MVYDGIIWCMMYKMLGSMEVIEVYNTLTCCCIISSSNHAAIQTPYSVLTIPTINSRNSGATPYYSVPTIPAINSRCSGPSSTS